MVLTWVRLPFRGYLAMSGGIVDCNHWVEICPCTRQPPAIKNDQWLRPSDLQYLIFVFFIEVKFFILKKLQMLKT